MRRARLPREDPELDERDGVRIARWHPLAEYGGETIKTSRKRNRRGRARWTRAALTADYIEAAVGRTRKALRDDPDFAAELNRKGRDRALIYRTLALTRLRKGELASPTAGQ